MGTRNDQTPPAGVLVTPRRRELSGRRLILEPLEKRQLLAVVTVTAPDPSAAEAGNDPGSFSIALSDAEEDVSYTVYFTLSGGRRRRSP